MTPLPITPSDYDRLSPFFRHQRYPLCAYSLQSIIVWRNEDYRPYYTLDGDTLVVCAEFAVNPEKRHLILPISPVRDYSPLELQDLALNLGFDTYWFVPEDYIRRHGRHQVETCFEISEQTEYADYIYRTEDLAQLKGNRFSKKRNLINQFERRYMSGDRIRLEPITRRVAGECIDFLEKWCDAHPCDIESDEDLTCEKIAATNAIEGIEQLRLDSLLLRIDGEVSAFGIGTGLTDTMGVLHFEKAYAHIKGLYQFFDRQCAREIFSGYPYLNKESDMDVPGLAKAKKSYHPVDLLKSYHLALR